MAYYYRHLLPSSKMISILPLLVVAVLVSQQNGFEANAQIVESKLTSTNILQTNVKEPVKRVWQLNKYVHISMPPVEELRRMTGERYVLECVAIGNPPPSINWMKNGQTIQDQVEEVNEILPTATEGFGMLTSKIIISASTPGEDKYICVAEGGVERDTATATVVTVSTNDDEEDSLNQDQFLISKPTITYIYNELLLDIGSLVILPCRVHSLTTFQTMWHKKNGRPIHSTSGMRVLPSGDLQISSLRMADTGNFTCVVKNMHGTDSASTYIYPVKAMIISYFLLIIL